MTILQEAVASVLERRTHYREAKDYYEGDVPEVFATAALRRTFRASGDRSRLNFCRPVVDAVVDRLEIANISGDTKRATDEIAKIWKRNDLGLEAAEIHRMTVVYGDCYVMAWPGADGDIQISYNAPTQMSLVYDPEDPRKKLYAVKMWRVSETETRLNIYTDTFIRKYKTNSGDVTEGTNWFETEVIDNPFGQIPVFHFRTHRPFGRPEHYAAYDAQNAINKLFVTNMMTIDYQGAPQRYALASMGDGGEMQDFNDGDTERENLGAIRNGPGELWFLKGVTQVGEFKPADAMAFWTPIEKVRDSIASLTNTPVHYLTTPNYGTPTGSALRVSESPLLKKIAARQMSIGYSWRDVFKFCLAIEGIKSDVVVTWTTHESLDELERWDVAAKKVNVGLSQRQALREGGYTEDQIEKIVEERMYEDEIGQTAYRRAARTDVNNDETNALRMPNATDEQGNEKRR